MTTVLVRFTKSKLAHDTDTLRVMYPIRQGVVVDWDEFELLIADAFTKMNADPYCHPVLLTEAPLNPKANREKLVEMLFETFDVPRAYVAIDGVLALYASGRLSGCIVQSGMSGSTSMTDLRAKSFRTGRVRDSQACEPL